MEINKITQTKSVQTFCRGFDNKAKIILAKTIDALKAKGKMLEAQDCITLTQIIAKKAENHTIMEVWDKLFVVPDNRNIGTSLYEIRVTPNGLKKNLKKILQFLDQDNHKISQVKEIAAKILPELQDSGEGLLTPGWKGIQTKVYKGNFFVTVHHGSGQKIAEQLARLSLDKKNPQIVEDGIKLYKEIQTHSGQCAIYVGNDGRFIIRSVRDNFVKSIGVFDLFNGNVDILKRLKLVKRTVEKAEKTRVKKILKEEKMAEREKLKAELIFKKIERTKAIKQYFSQSFPGKFYAKLKEYFLNSIDLKQARMRKTIEAIENNINGID